ncbi:MAG: radical SAM protein [Clostridia bacterium]|nr:radical SAM protein [Clostridia bacterium]
MRSFDNIARSHCLSEAAGCSKGLLLQWHITERCNYRCTHCYQEDYSGKELDYTQLLSILEQFKQLLLIRNAKTKTQNFRSHITVTGGEPFVREDFMRLLEVLSSHKHLFSFSILTNGSLITPAVSRYLKKLQPSFVQVSIEGNEVTHDKIRGNESYRKVCESIKLLVKEGIRTYISFTAHRDNYKEFPDVAFLGRRLRVAKVWSDRLIPAGSGTELCDKLLTPNETQEFFEIMHRCKKKPLRFWSSRTEITMNRALQFLVDGGKPYHCTAGDTLITVQPNGYLLPCRRMPIVVGNLMETPLPELYYNSKLLKELRDKYKSGDNCSSCFYSKLCRGGLKCLSYAVTGNPFNTDPGCWMKDEVKNR